MAKQKDKSKDKSTQLSCPTRKGRTTSQRSTLRKKRLTLAAVVLGVRLASAAPVPVRDADPCSETATNGVPCAEYYHDLS